MAGTVTAAARTGPCLCFQVRTHFGRVGMLSLAPSRQDTLRCEPGSGQKQLQGSVFPRGFWSVIFPPSLCLTWWSLERKPSPWLSITIIITAVSAGPCSCTSESPQPRPLVKRWMCCSAVVSILMLAAAD